MDNIQLLDAAGHGRVGHYRSSVHFARAGLRTTGGYLAFVFTCGAGWRDVRYSCRCPCGSPVTFYGITIH
jgi:hypothetical protein